MADARGTDAGESLDFSDVPDPAATVARLPPPAAVVPAAPSPTRDQRRLRILIAAAIAAAWVVALTMRFGVRGDLDGAGLIKIGVWAAMGVAVVLAVAPRRRALGPGARTLQAAVVAVPVLFALVAAFTARGAPGDGLASGALFACATAGFALAAGPIAVAGLVARRAFAVHPVLRGAALGALGGLWGSIAIQAHCPVEALAHVLIAHGAPLLLGALLGAAFGARFGRL